MQRSIAVRSLIQSSSSPQQEFKSHGKESIHTIFLQRNPLKPYHIDYVFASADLLPERALKVSTPADWLPPSDHLPLMVTLKG